ncbi:MAG: hypothetical protein AAF456_14110 [Planctomycetota bacterium]
MRCQKLLSCLSLVLFSTVAFSCATALAQQDLARFDAPVSWQDDAELTDIYFLDAQRGWCVGDQGTILRTNDGGSNWRTVSTAPQMRDNIAATLQTTPSGVMITDVGETKPVRCRFETVFFVDEQHGWVAGGFSVPYVNRSRGFLMRTTDGGRTWHVIQGLVIPRITQIHFKDPYTGRATGDRSSLYPSGVFHSTDGGVSWSSEMSQSGDDWTRSQSTASGVVAVNRSGTISIVDPNGTSDCEIAAADAGRVTDIAMIDDRTGWAVGKQGTVLLTSDGGTTWTTPTNLSVEAARTNDPDTIAQIENNIRLARQFDFNSITLTSSKIWIAADPGSLFSIDRQTGEFRRHHTGVATPLNRIRFVDDQHGWATGVSGTIVATNNGGDSWHVQRNAGQGVALLSVATVNHSLDTVGNYPAWQALARYAGEDNYLTAVLTIDESESSGAIESSSIAQAVSRIGGSYLVEDHFSTLSAEGRTRLIEQLTRRIRAIQPRVVLAGSDPQINEAVRQAVAAARDSSAFSDQLGLAGLSTWQVDRIAFIDPSGTTSVSLRQMLPRSGCLIEDRIAVSRALVGQPPFANDETRYTVEHISTAAGANSRQSGLFSGLEYGQRLPKRKRDNGIRGTMAAIRHLSQKQNLMTAVSSGAQTADFRRDQIQAFVGPLDFTTSGLWVLQLAEEYAEAGKFDMAAEMMELFAIRYNEHALAPAALFWLANFYSSDEITRDLFANLESATQQVTDGPAPIAATPRVQNIDGVMKVTYEVDTSALPDDKPYHYGSDAPEVIVDDRTVFQRWRDRRTAARADSNPGTTEPVESSEPPPEAGLSANAVPEFGMRDQEERPTVSEVAMSIDLIDPTAAFVEEQPEISAEELALLEAEKEQALSEFAFARLARANRVLTMIEQGDPDIGLSAEFNFLEAKISRQLGGWVQSEQLYSRLTRDRGGNTNIKLAALREEKAHGNAGLRGSSPFRSAFTEERPYLDGSPDDLMWQTATSENRIQTLSNGDRIAFANDDEYLYVFYEAQKLPGHRYAFDDEMSTGEQTLQNDRIVLRIDSDRDFNMTADFIVSASGATLDGWSGWYAVTQEWFVATATSESTWTAELAIPFSRLGASDSRDLLAQLHLAVDVRRIDPGDRVIGGASASRVAEQYSPGLTLLGSIQCDPRQFEMLALEPADNVRSAGISGRPEEPLVR